MAASEGSEGTSSFSVAAGVITRQYEREVKENINSNLNIFHSSKTRFSLFFIVRKENFVVITVETSVFNYMK